MLSGDFFARTVRAVARRPVPVLAAVGLLAVLAAVFALRLQPSASTDTLVNRSSAAFKATESYKKEFGDDAVVILVKGDLERTLLTSDLATLVKLEGCLSGNVPAKSTIGPNGQVTALGRDRMPPECTALANTKPVKVVYGPGTFINTAAERINQGILAQSQQAQQQVQQAQTAARVLAKAKGLSKAKQDQLAAAAGQLALQKFISQALSVALQYGLTSTPSIDNTEFVSQLMFDPTKGVNVPKARFAFIEPSPRAALIQVRLKPNLSDQQRRRAISLVERATQEKAFRLNNGQHYVVSGVPVVADALAHSVQQAIIVLLIAVVLVMAAVLALVFRARIADAAAGARPWRGRARVRRCRARWAATSRWRRWPRCRC